MVMYAPQPVEKNPEQRVMSMFLYVICCLAAIIQYGQSIGMVVVGCLITGFAGFLLKAQRATAKDTTYASHVEWTARTLKIGGTYLFPIAIIVALYIIYDATGIEHLRHALAKAGESDDDMSSFNLLKTYMATNEDRINSITNWCLTPPIFWWCRRCWFGLMRADKHEPIDFPDGIF